MNFRYVSGIGSKWNRLKGIIYIGFVHIVHEACSYSIASSVMEHILAVHSVIWYLSHRAKHSLHLH